MKIVWIISGLLLLGIVFFVVDCAAGHSGCLDCIVIDHQYKAPWTETWTTTDDKGSTHFHSQYHPEEWHVFCRELKADTEFDIETPHAQYITVTNHQNVEVVFREGRWTHAKYMSSISEYKGVER